MDKFHSDLKKFLIASSSIAAFCICFFGYTLLTTPEIIPVSKQTEYASVNDQRTITPPNVSKNPTYQNIVDQNSTNLKTPAEEPATDHKPDIKTFVDGMQIVGIDIEAGTYESTDPSSSCNYEKLSGQNSSKGRLDISASGVSQKRITITISPNDTALMSSGCGTWKKTD